MPWEETCAMDQRLKFVAACLAGDEPMAWICERFNISRKTGYKWLERYETAGAAGLQARSSAPHQPGQAMAPDIRERILQLRQAKPHWGPKKIRAKLLERYPGESWPANSSIGDLLKRCGLVAPRRKRHRTPPQDGPLTGARAPNDVWCTDYKGWVTAKDGQRCDPLTVTDAFSRFLLAAELVARLDHAHAQPIFDRLFREFGLPSVIRSDNGTPFASTGVGGLSALSIWWLKLGIRPERTEPGKPQQNGRHERMHRTMLEAMSPPAENRADQQTRLDDFRREFNAERPHEALGQRPPANFYASSPRAYDGTEQQPDYAAHQAVRMVRSNGEIKWQGQLIFLGEALVGEPVAISDHEDAWAVHYFDVLLGYVDPKSVKIRRPERGHAPVQGTSSVT